MKSDEPFQLTPPNVPFVYTHTETRTGPPLSYVASKLRGCIFSLHSLNNLGRIAMPGETQIRVS